MIIVYVQRYFHGFKAHLRWKIYGHYETIQRKRTYLLLNTYSV